MMLPISRLASFSTWSISFFSEKWNDFKLKYLMCDKEFYTTIPHLGSLELLIIAQRVYSLFQPRVTQAFEFSTEA